MKTLAECGKYVNDRLQELLPEIPQGSLSHQGGMPWLLSDAMRYSVFAGGKRLRPSMMLMAAEMLGGNLEDVLDLACAVEMIHTYSLIHDDLPGMDNDTMRRGRPTNHVVFTEGQAILAGDGLLNFAFETMLRSALSHAGHERAYLSAISEIATGAGVTGMIAGQVIDLYAERESRMDSELLEYIQLGKTACMFLYPLRAVGRALRASEETLTALEQYGRSFGLLFQATDDLLDVIGDSSEVGKTLGKDAEQGKLTCVTLHGVEATRARAQACCAQATTALSPFGEKAEGLIQLAESMLNRTT